MCFIVLRSKAVVNYMTTTRQWEIQNSLFGTPVDGFSRLSRAQNMVRVIEGKLI